MSTRKTKVKKELAITSKEGANDTLREIAEAEAQVEAIRDDAAKARTKIDEDEAAKTKPLLEKIKRLQDDLEAWSRHHLKTGGFGDKRSEELPSGFIGFRRSSKTTRLKKLKVDEVAALIEAAAKKKSKLGALLKKHLGKIIVVKKSPDIRAIKALGLSDADMEKIGLKIQQDDIFAYSTDKKKALDLSDIDADAKGKAA